MADAKLVKRLRQGSDVWNAWRERRNTDVRLNLTTTFDNIDLQDYQSPWEARQGIREYLTYSNQ